MCNKNGFNVSQDVEMDSDSNISTDSSDNDTDSMDSETETEQAANVTQEDEANSDEESEDEVIKAIKRECERKNNHPPIIQCTDFVTDISFHPHNDILAVATIVGDVIFYKYSSEENTVLSKYFTYVLVDNLQ